MSFCRKFCLLPRHCLRWEHVIAKDLVKVSCHCKACDLRFRISYKRYLKKKTKKKTSTQANHFSALVQRTSDFHHPLTWLLGVLTKWDLLRAWLWLHIFRNSLHLLSSNSRINLWNSHELGLLLLPVFCITSAKLLAQCSAIKPHGNPLQQSLLTTTREQSNAAWDTERPQCNPPSFSISSCTSLLLKS